jgi:hypothetical protein
MAIWVGRYILARASVPRHNRNRDRLWHRRSIPSAQNLTFQKLGALKLRVRDLIKSVELGPDECSNWRSNYRSVWINRRVFQRIEFFVFLFPRSRITWRSGTTRPDQCRLNSRRRHLSSRDNSGSLQRSITGAGHALPERAQSPGRPPRSVVTSNYRFYDEFKCYRAFAPECFPYSIGPIAASIGALTYNLTKPESILRHVP